MIDHGDSGGDYRILELELESLYRTLILTSLAIQTYEHTPLGQHLAHSIVPEVEQVCVVLQQLFDKLKDYQQGLMSTSIRALWYRIRQNCCEADEGLTSLRAKLATSQKLLGQFLIALNSWVSLAFNYHYPLLEPSRSYEFASISWEVFGNGVRAGHINLKDFHACSNQGPLSLRHIQVDKILVVDHLGWNIPVPTIFCSTWKVGFLALRIFCMTNIRKSGFWLYHQWILQKSLWNPLHGAGWLWSFARWRLPSDWSLRIFQQGRTGHGSRNGYCHAGDYHLAGQQGQMSSVSPRQFECHRH